MEVYYMENTSAAETVKNETKPNKFKNSLLWRILFAVSTPLFCYIIAEVSQSGAGFITAVPFKYILLNLFYYGSVYFLLLSLTRSTKISSTLLTVGVFAFTTVNYYTMLWRTIPLTYGDLECASTVGSVLKGYNLVVPTRLVVTSVMLLLYIAAVIVAPTANSKRSTGKRLLRSSVGAALAVVLICIAYGITSPSLDLVDASGVHFEKYGYAVSFVSNAKSMKIEAPKGYSPEKAEEILSQYEAGEDAELYPNIIIVMNESLCDLQTISEFETDREYLSFINEFKKECVSGELMTFGLGGGTSTSEFELLTRSSQILLPYTSVAYMQYIKKDIPTLTTTLGSYKKPYRITAMHPAQAINYNRDKNYPLMGIDKFLDREYFSDLSNPRGYLDDRQCYERMMEYFYSTDESTPQMIFNITIQNHGGYFDTCDLGTEAVKITSFDATYDAERYLTLIKQSDEALKGLIEELSQCDRPVILLVFGDHQPLLENAFYEELLGDMEGWTDEDYLSRHRTPFLIWSNYGSIEPESMGLTSLNYLSSILLQKANLPLTQYDSFLLDMREDIPAMCGCVYYTSDGVLHTVGDEENQWLDNYAILQYGCLFDSDNINWNGYDMSLSNC